MPSPTAPQHLADLASVQPGAIVSRMLLKGPGGTVTLFAFGAGEGLSEHTTPHDALVVVLDGAVAIDVGGTSHRLQADETLVLPADVPHALRAETDMTMLLVMLRSDVRRPAPPTEEPSRG